MAWPLYLYALGVSEVVQAGGFGDSDHWPHYWDELSSHARLVWAKWAALHSSDRKARQDA